MTPLAVESLTNDGSGPYRVRVNGTYYRWACVVAPTKKEAMRIARLVAKQVRKPRKRRP